jgi:hypothetical protein
MSEALPPLKGGLETLPIEHEGKAVIMLRDLEGIAEQSLVISMGAFLIAMMLDGKSNGTEVCQRFLKETGSSIEEEQVKKLVEQLQSAHFLETPQLQERRHQILTEFRTSPIRKARMSGVGYPSNPVELAGFMGKFFQDAKGPRKEVLATPIKNNPPLALFSPHIDLDRGGPAYAWAYQALSECPPPDLIVALGVAHMGPNSPWVMTPKSYETPYGLMEVDQTAFEEFNQSLWYDVRDDEWVHRLEHSLEFQALWLRYLWKNQTPKWIPILCSSFDRFCPDQSPRSVATIEEGLQKMGRVLKSRIDSGKRVTILAAVDLAHVGPRFGDKEKVDDAVKEKVKKEDLESIQLAMAGDADGFYMSCVQNGHWRKICGLSSIYTALRLMREMDPSKEVKGEMLTYDQSEDPLGGLVSFASFLYE